MFNIDDVFSTDLRAHAYLCRLLHLDIKFSIKNFSLIYHSEFIRTASFYLLLHLLGQHVAQINRLGIFPRTHQLHGSHKGQVVCDDLAQLGEMPAIPF